jgi:hypothetical protein
MERYGRPKKSKFRRGPVGAKSARKGGNSRPMSLIQSSATYILYENGTCNYRLPDSKQLCQEESAATKSRGKRRCYRHLAL